MTIIFHEITGEAGTPGLKLEASGNPAQLANLIKLLGLKHYSVTARGAGEVLLDKRPKNLQQMHTHQWKGQTTGTEHQWRGVIE